MKKLTIKLSLAIFAIGISNFISAQQVDKKVLNWYNGKKAGMGTEKAYKKVKKKDSKTVVVAVIDSGIDVEHEDLQGQIWVNPGEIAGNGIDDDKNGYIDDIHGWNFLGSTSGENQDGARLELTRIYAQLKPKYEDVESKDVSSDDRKEYELFKEVEKTYLEDRAEYEAALAGTIQFRDQMLPMIPTIVGNAMGNTEYTLKELEKWEPEEDQMKQLKEVAIQLKSGKLSASDLDAAVEQYESFINYYYNADYDDRQYVGDDPHDFSDLDFGNNDVEGPDALHGTHVGGIIGAVRGNDLGGDGVATNVKLMSLRAVPNGDEQDKDVAMAIRYAVDNGADIINGSFGKAYSMHQKEVYDAIIYAQDNDVLFIHAAGNDHKDVDVEPNFPAVMYDFQTEPFTHVLTIGASSRFKKGRLAANFSNYGEKSVDVFAPGAEIYNTLPDNKYKELQGTSMAAPMVAGAAAFIKSYYPELTMAQVKDILLKSARDYSDTEQTMPGMQQPKDSEVEEKKVEFGTLSVTGAVIYLPEAVKMAEEITNPK